MTWANQVRMLQENFKRLGAVIGQPIINALKPMVKALNAALMAVTQFAEKVSAALGKIFGWEYESGSAGIAVDLGDASDSAGDLADSTGDASKNTDKANKAAKQLKKTLSTLPFDQLNKLADNSNSSNSGSGSGGSGSGSGGSGGAGGGTGANQGTWKRVTTMFESNIDNLYDLGRYISDTLSKAMESIDWDSVYEKARNFGTGLADFLNGLISPRLFYNVGKTISNSLNTAIYAALSFGEEFDWTNFGLSIAEGINGFFQNFDFEALATTLNTWVNGIETVIGTALVNIDWGSVLGGIGDFLLSLEPDTIAAMIGVVALDKFGKNMAEAISGKLKTSIITYFKENPLKVAGIALTISSFLVTINNTGDLNKTIESSVMSIIGTTMITKNLQLGLIVGVVIAAVNLAVSVGNWLGKKLGEYILNKNGEDGSKAWEIEDISIKSAIKFELTWLFKDDEEKEKLRTRLQTLLDGAGLQGLMPILDIQFGLGHTFEDTKAALKVAFDDDIEKIKQKFEDFGANLKTKWENLKEYFSERVDKVVQFFQKIPDKLKELPAKFFTIGIQMMQGLINGILNNPVVQFIVTIVNNIIDKFKTLLGIHSPSTVFAAIGRNIMAGLLNGLTGKVVEVLAWFANLPQNIKDKLGDAKTWISEKGKNALEGLRSGWDSVKESKVGQAAQKIGSYVKDKAGNATQWIKSKGSDAISGLRSGWDSVKQNGFLNTVGQIGNQVYKNIGNLASKVRSKGSDIVGGLKDGFNNNSWRFFNIFSGIGSKITSSIGNLWNLGHRVIRDFVNGLTSVNIKLPHISWRSKSVGIGNFSFSIPSFKVNWYKKGGLFDKASMIGVGEAGREAVLPLENKKTMSMIADSITKNSGGMGISEEQMQAAVERGVAMAMMNNRQDINVQCVAEFKTSDEALARAVSKGQQKIEYRMKPVPAY